MAEYPHADSIQPSVCAIGITGVKRLHSNAMRSAFVDKALPVLNSAHDRFPVLRAVQTFHHVPSRAIAYVFLQTRMNQLYLTSLIRRTRFLLRYLHHTNRFIANDQFYIMGGVTFVTYMFAAHRRKRIADTILGSL
ncbi:unnamed protein product [Dicrocoelium dendriticum]|nr:unnamed protein product [Dicrocoelium dendriticum]